MIFIVDPRINRHARWLLRPSESVRVLGRAGTVQLVQPDAVRGYPSALLLALLLARVATAAPEAIVIMLADLS